MLRTLNRKLLFLLELLKLLLLSPQRQPISLQNPLPQLKYPRLVRRLVKLMRRLVRLTRRLVKLMLTNQLLLQKLVKLMQRQVRLMQLNQLLMQNLARVTRRSARLMQLNQRLILAVLGMRRKYFLGKLLHWHLRQKSPKPMQKTRKQMLRLVKLMLQDLQLPPVNL